MRYLRIIFNTYDWKAIIFAVLLCGMGLGGNLRIPQPLYLGFAAFLILYYISKGKLQVSGFIIAWIAYVYFSIFLASPPPLFRSGSRFLVFTFNMLLVGPLLDSPYFRQFRKQAFETVMIVLAIIGTVSFFCYFLGINMMTNDVNLMRTGGGYFSAITEHSMTLGPYAALGTLAAVFQYKECRKKIFLFFAITCAIATLLSGARGAVISMIVGLAALMLYMYRNKSKSVTRIFVVVLVLGLSSPLWEFALTNVTVKSQKNQESSGSSFSSRDSKVDYRLEEFMSSPLYGIGFAAVSIDHPEEFNALNGQTEPGVSALTVLSMTGIVGFIFFAILMWRAFIASKNSKTLSAPLLFGSLLLLLLHSQTEAYIFAGGSQMGIIYWLIVTRCIECKSDNLKRHVYIKK